MVTGFDPAQLPPREVPACAYAQGMNLLRVASRVRNYSYDIAELARIWKAGCIIRAQFLGRIQAAFHSERGLPNLLLDPEFSEELAARPQVVAGNKSELPDTEKRRRALERFCKAEGLPFHAVSAATGLGLSGLGRDVAQRPVASPWPPAAV